jgi:hypothetical protein
VNPGRSGGLIIKKPAWGFLPGHFHQGESEITGVPQQLIKPIFAGLIECCGTPGMTDSPLGKMIREIPRLVF